MKDNFKLLNNVEIDVNKYEDLKIDNKEKLKANLRTKIKQNKKSNKGLIAASIGLISIGIIGAGTINPSLADSIPSVQKMFIELNKKLNLGYDTITQTQDIKLSSTVNGITINIEEAISDGNSLYLTYTINSKDKPLTDKMNNINYEPLVEIEASNKIGLAGQYLIETESGGVQEEAKGYYKDEFTFIGIKKYNIISDNQIPEEFNVNMKIKELYNLNDEEMNIKGPWEFEFKVKKSVVSKKININQAKGEYKINYIETTPFTMKLNIQLPETYAAQNNKETKRIEIEDDKGNQLYRMNCEKGEIERNMPNSEIVKLENGTITTDITLSLDNNIGTNKPKYVIIKFVDYKNTVENGEIIKHEKNEETKDIEFKIKID